MGEVQHRGGYTQVHVGWPYIEMDVHTFMWDSCCVVMDIHRYMSG